MIIAEQQVNTINTDYLLLPVIEEVLIIKGASHDVTAPVSFVPKYNVYDVTTFSTMNSKWIRTCAKCAELYFQYDNDT